MAIQRSWVMSMLTLPLDLAVYHPTCWLEAHLLRKFWTVAGNLYEDVYEALSRDWHCIGQTLSHF